MPNLYVPLPSEAIERLRLLARREFRNPKAQAAVLILAGLDREVPGPDSQPDDTTPAARDRRPIRMAEAKP